MTVHEMVKAYMREHGIKGLCADWCGCSVDDIEPCGDMNGECESAEQRRCPAGAECQYGLDECGGPCWKPIDPGRLVDAGKGVEETK